MAEITGPAKAIRAYCLECVCGDKKAVRECEITRCPLHPFRFGKNPYYGMKSGLNVEDTKLIAEGIETAETPTFPGDFEQR